MSADSPGRHASLWKGLAAGLVAGLVATAAKSLTEKFYPPRTHGEPEPPELLADRVAGNSLDASTEELAGEVLRWGFGAAAGAFYGALAEFYPAATSKEGTNFGLTLMALTHEGVLPAMALSGPPEQQSEREQSSEAASHLVFGVVAEWVRHTVRELLG